MGNAEYMGFSFDPMADRNKSDSKGLAIPGREGEYLDPRTLSTTPGGSIYGTTPGGTKIMYTRDALLFLGSSPICKTPPSGMAHIPGINAPGKIETPEPNRRKEPPKKEAPTTAGKPSSPSLPLSVRSLHPDNFLQNQQERMVCLPWRINLFLYHSESRFPGDPRFSSVSALPLDGINQSTFL